MTDSEDESSHSLQHDKMSVSDLDDEEVSRDDVPSAELSAEAGQNSNNHEDPNPISTSSGVKLLDCHVEKRNEVSVQAAHMFATVDLMDDAAVNKYFNYFRVGFSFCSSIFNFFPVYCRWN